MPADSSKYTSGAIVTALDNAGGLVRTGFKVAGWNTLTDGTGTDRAAGSTFSMPQSNLTLHALWTPLAVTMISIPGRTYTMGSASGGDDNERPTHTKTISAFLMNKFEITQAQYSSVTGENPSAFSTGSFAPAQPAEEMT